MKQHLCALPFCLLLGCFISCSDLDRTDPKDLTGVAWLENSQESSSATASSSSEAALSSADSYSSSQALSSTAIQSSSSKASSSSALSPANSSSLGASSSSLSSISSGTLLIGSRYYKTVKIGDQTWMAENLKEGRFVDASLSDPAYTGEGQVSDSLEKYCFNNSEPECETRGGLYTWAEAMGYSSDCKAIMGCSSALNALCPDGWRLPSKSDFNKLIEYAGGMDEAGAMLKAYSGNTSWNNPAYNKNDPLGFGAIGAGFYTTENRFKFEMDGGAAVFWTSDDEFESSAHTVILLHNKAAIGDTDPPDFVSHEKTIGASVRCIQDTKP